MPPSGSGVRNKLFDSGNLASANHTLLMTAVGGGTVTLDFLLYTPADDTERTGEDIYIDNTDSRVVYNHPAQWTKSFIDSVCFFNQTSTADQEGATFTVHFYGERHIGRGFTQALTSCDELRR